MPKNSSPHILCFGMTDEGNYFGNFGSQGKPQTHCMCPDGFPALLRYFSSESSGLLHSFERVQLQCHGIRAEKPQLLLFLGLNSKRALYLDPSGLEKDLAGS